MMTRYYSLHSTLADSLRYEWVKVRWVDLKLGILRLDLLMVLEAPLAFLHQRMSQVNRSHLFGVLVEVWEPTVVKLVFVFDC